MFANSQRDFKKTSKISYMERCGISSGTFEQILKAKLIQSTVKVVRPVYLQLWN